MIQRNPARFADADEARRVAEAFDLRRLPPSFYANPYPTYHALREHAPVHPLPGGTGEAEACALPKIADMMLPKILMGQLHCERAPRSPSIADPGHLLTHPRDFVNRPLTIRCA